MKPGRELDALVAEKVMGLTVRSEGRYHVGPCFSEEGHHEDIVPYYSTGIAAAWEVVEHFNETMPKTWAFSLFGSGNDWHVEIDSNDGRFLQNGPSIQVFEHAETAPHAICLAALKSVGVEAPS